MKKIPKTIRSQGSQMLAQEALDRGITVKHLDPHYNGPSFMEFVLGKHTEYIKGQMFGLTLRSAQQITTDKFLTKEFLNRASISTLQGKVFNENNNIEEMDVYCKKIGYPVVIKPFNGALGRDVFVNINDKKELSVAVKKSAIKTILIEKMFVGTEYRILTTASKVLAIMRRIPANVIGDGKNTISKLIAIKNTIPNKTSIKIDKWVRECLAKNNKKLTDIPKEGEVVYVRENSNISTGGDSIAIDKIHPDIRKIAIASVKAVHGLPYAGVDFLTNKDILEKPTKRSYAILEMNSSPGLFMHHYPFAGKACNVTKELIDLLFPETKKK